MNTWNEFIKPIVVLGSICLVSSTLLAITNNATAPVIEQNAIKAANAARAEVLPAASSFSEVKTSAEGILEMYEAENGSGWVLTAAAKGYGGDVPVMVAFDADGKLSGVKFLDNAETPGLGQKVKEPWFAKQFAGRESKNFSLSDIDAVSGATISSGAAVKAINYAIDCYNAEVKGEEVVVLTPEEVRAKILPDAGEITLQTEALEGVTEWYKGTNYGRILYVEGSGFYKKPLTAAVAFDDSGAITGVWFDASNETDGVGQQVGSSEAFAAQFAGKTEVDGIEAVAGATVSSNAAADAVKAAVEANKKLG